MSKYKQNGTITFSPTAVTDKEEVHNLHKKNEDVISCDWEKMVNKPFGDYADTVSVIFDGAFDCTDNEIINVDKKFGFELGETYRITIDGNVFGYGTCHVTVSGSYDGTTSYERYGLNLYNDDESEFLSIGDNHEYVDVPHIDSEATIQYSNIMDEADSHIPGVHTLRIEKVTNHTVKQIAKRFVPNCVEYVSFYAYEFEELECSHTLTDLIDMMYNETIDLIFVFKNENASGIDYIQIDTVRYNNKLEYIDFYLFGDSGAYIRYDADGLEYNTGVA